MHSADTAAAVRVAKAMPNWQDAIKTPPPSFPCTARTRQSRHSAANSGKRTAQTVPIAAAPACAAPAGEPSHSARNRKRSAE